MTLGITPAQAAELCVGIIRRHDGEAVDDLGQVAEVLAACPDLADRVHIGADAGPVDAEVVEGPTHIEDTLTEEQIHAVSRICDPALSYAQGRAVRSVAMRRGPTDRAVVDIGWSELADAGGERTTCVRYRVDPDGRIDEAI